MQEWIKRHSVSAPLEKQPRPYPVVEAYYRRSFSSSARGAPQLDSREQQVGFQRHREAELFHNDNKELQRISINTEVLRTELESVTGITVSHAGVPVMLVFHSVARVGDS